MSVYFAIKCVETHSSSSSTACAHTTDSGNTTVYLRQSVCWCPFGKTLSVQSCLLSLNSVYHFNPNSDIRKGRGPPNDKLVRHWFTESKETAKSTKKDTHFRRGC
jgi:hypothetical protein